MSFNRFRARSASTLTPGFKDVSRNQRLAGDTRLTIKTKRRWAIEKGGLASGLAQILKSLCHRPGRDTARAMRPRSSISGWFEPSEIILRPFERQFAQGAPTAQRQDRQPLPRRDPGSRRPAFARAPSQPEHLVDRPAGFSPFAALRADHAAGVAVRKIPPQFPPRMTSRHSRDGRKRCWAPRLPSKIRRHAQLSGGAVTSSDCPAECARNSRWLVFTLAQCIYMRQTTLVRGLIGTALSDALPRTKSAARSGRFHHWGGLL